MYKVPRKRKLQVVCVFAILAVAASTYAEQPATLWSFLGIPQGANKIRDSLFNRRGNHPRLERKPPLKAIADPGFLVPEAGFPEVVQVAAEIKTAEDLAPQKIKAVKYLAKIGCGCYNDGNKITDALLAALEDCTEKVRVAAVEAIGEAASCAHCLECQQGNCCSGAITQKLMDMASKQDENGCWLEPSERVRNAAAVALQYCTPVVDPDLVPDPDKPRDPDAPPAKPRDPDGPAKTTAQTRLYYPATSGSSLVDFRRSRASEPPSSRRQFTSRIPSAGRSRRNRVTTAQHHRPNAPVQLPPTRSDTPIGSDNPIRPEGQTQIGTPRRADTEAIYPTRTVSDVAKAISPRTGMVDFVDQTRQTAVARFSTRDVLPLGTIVSVYRQFASGPVEVGRMQVVRTKAGVSELLPFGRTELSSIATGDGVVVLNERP